MERQGASRCGDQHICDGSTTLLEDVRSPKATSKTIGALEQTGVFIISSVFSISYVDTNVKKKMYQRQTWDATMGNVSS